jgi:lysophospholipase L1-like esterase
MSITGSTATGSINATTTPGVFQLPDGTTFALNRVSAGLRGKPLVSGKCGSGSVAPFPNIKTTFGTLYTFPYGASNIQLVYSNIIVNAAGGEADASGPVTVSASVELVKGQTPLLVTFSGATSGTANTNGVELVSDEIPVDIAPGGTLWVNTCASGTNIPGCILTESSANATDGLGWSINSATNASPIVLGGAQPHGFTTGDAIKVLNVNGNTAANVTTTATVVDATHVSLDGTTGNGAYTNNGYALGSDLTTTGSVAMRSINAISVFAPIAIIGTPLLGARIPCVGVAGDSISRGTGDTIVQNGGWIARSMGGPYNVSIPYTLVGRGGTKGVDFTDTTSYGTKSIRRRRIIMALPNVFWAYGTNDFNTGSTTAQVQTSVLAFATQAYQRGNRCFVATVLPITTSSDSFVTVANQTKGAGFSQRAPFNSWLRDGAPLDQSTLQPAAVGLPGALRIGQAGHPIYKVIDIASVAEVDANNQLFPNGGFWIVNGTANYATTDGTHPTSVMHIAMSQLVNLAWFAAL